MKDFKRKFTLAKEVFKAQYVILMTDRVHGTIMTASPKRAEMYFEEAEAYFGELKKNYKAKSAARAKEVAKQ